MNYIDFIIIGILVIYMCVGYFKGFMFSMLSLFSFTVKFLITVVLCKPFMFFTNNVCKLDVALSNSFAKGFSKTSELFDLSLEGMSQQQITDHVASCLNTTKYPNLIKSFFKSIFTIPEGTQSSFNDIISKTLGSFLSLIISFVIIFIIICVIVFFLKNKCKQLTENSVTVKKVDKFFGIGYGFAHGIITLVIVFAVLSWFKTLPFLTGLFNSIYDSFLGGFATNTIFPLMDKYLNLKEIARWFINLL